ncbi:DUF2116 family Zn-ribbon domain-containing protein [Pseudomonas guariconensis]|uniref:DUF2116 family Zn-ribbon domain-containing protein n=1 Tax=Pseudomonas guariconensis TaxID=1288410 RepID=UPI000B82FF63
MKSYIEWRHCVVCNSAINPTSRSHRKTCSQSCRSKLSRASKKAGLLVQLRLPVLQYTNLVIAALSTGKRLGEYICDALPNPNKKP